MARAHSAYADEVQAGAQPAADDPEEYRRQRFEIAGYLGLGLGGDFDEPAGRITFEDGASFALMVTGRVAGPFFAELTYSRRPSTVTLNPAGGAGGDPTVMATDNENIDVGIEYYQAGLTYRWSSPVKWLTPLVGASLGATRVDVVDDNVDIADAWQFAWAVFPGVQFDLHKYFAIRLQARFLFTDVIKGHEVYCGGQPNCDVNTRSVVSVQEDLAAGFVLKF